MIWALLLRSSLRGGKSAAWLMARKFPLLSVQVITDQNLQNVILVGHSLAGVWMQQMLQQMPERIGMMVFVDAVVLETGESFFSNKIAGVLSPHSAYAYPAQVQFHAGRSTYHTYR